MKSMSKRLGIWAASTLSLIVALNSSADSSCRFMPENDLHLEDQVDKVANITEEEFNRLIDQAAAVYAPIVQNHQATLVVNKRWTDSTVNASATQQGSQWIINMYGGFARRPEVSADGFQLVVCHELGHHLGGFPFKAARWAAAEGQADYFATQACARLLWRDDLETNASFRPRVNGAAKAACNAQWTSELDQNLCYRAAAAGHSLATLLAALSSGNTNQRRGIFRPRTPTAAKPDFTTPDMNRVTATDTNHPKAQCRLDTYFQGALCKAEFNRLVIPGKNHAAGQGSIEAEKEMEKYSCAGVYQKDPGIRPTCWFKSRLQEPAPQPEPRRRGWGRRRP